MELVSRAGPDTGGAGRPRVVGGAPGASMIQTIGYEATNAIGKVLCTFSQLDVARTWVKDRSVVHDGLHVVEVVTTVERRAAYRPRLRVVG